MNSRDAQDVILRLLADGPFRAAALAGSAALGPDVAAVLAGTDGEGLEHFGRFLCRHYYRERIVHYFKYSRALAAWTGRKPEAVLKTAEFNALLPELVLGERASASRVLELLRCHLLENAESIRAAVPYWDDLVGYESVFFLSDAHPPERAAPSARFPARSESATILELSYDLPPILPALRQLRASDLLAPASQLPQLPVPKQQPTRLLFVRSPRGEVTVLRCTDALAGLLERLTGEEDPAQIAAQMGLDRESFAKTLARLEKLGAVIAQESFSASHVGSEVSQAAGGGA